VRGRVVDIVLVAAVVIGALWLSLLVYHNHFGGHAPAPEAAELGNTEAPR